MGSRTETLSLELRAKFLAQGAIDSMKLGLDSVSSKYDGLKEKLEGMGRATAVGLGMAAETLLQGGSIGDAASQLGIHMASELTETFGEQFVTKLTSSSLLTAITGPIAAVGSTIGGIISAAIPIGMALLPFLLIGAIVGAVILLATNEDIRNKVIDFAKGVGKWIVDHIGPFVGKVIDFFLGIPGKLVELGSNIVKAIIDGLISLPGKIADVIRQAFAGLKIDIGPFHITGHGITIDLPDVNLPSPSSGAAMPAGQQHHAKGGWVGLHGPEIGMFGEEGPEYVVSNDQLGSIGGTLHLTLNVAGERLAELLLPMVSRELAYELMGSAPTGAKV